MKCLKNVKTNNIVRVDDVQARQMAGSTWVYISKSEWKTSTHVPETEKQVVETEKKEQTLSKKAEKAAKLKAKQRQ
jgi:hypothetical protein